MSGPSPHGVSDLDEEMLEGERRRARQKAQRDRRPRAQRIVAVVCAASALAGAFAPGEPTGTAALDIAYKAGFALVVSAAASRAKRWTWFVLAGVAGAASTDEWLPLALAVGAMAVAFGSIAWGRRQRELGAVVGALAVQALLRMPTDLAFAVPTVVALLAPVPLYLSALRNVRRPGRYLWPALALGFVLAVVGAAFGWGMLTVEQRARDGIRAARDGVAAAGDGEDASAATAFARAEAELAEAADTTGAWWLYPARAVPVLAQHVRVVEDVTRQGRALAAQSADQIATLDVDGLGDADGGFDLDRIADLAPRAAAVVATMDRTLDVLRSSDSPWLIDPVADRLAELEQEIADTAPAARVAAEALDLAPSLLGGDRARTYLVLVGNPAEARELGGFVASVGVLTADDGRIDFRGTKGISALNGDVMASGLEVEGDLPPPLPASQPEGFVQNWTNTVDVRAVTRLATDLGPAIAGTDVDGVLYLDPYAVAGLLEITGPVPLEGRDQPLTAENAPDFLLREQYLVDDPVDDSERKDRLSEAAELALDRLASSSLPDPRRFADVLSPVVRARRLLFSTAAPEAHDLLGRVGLRPPFDAGTVDQVLVAHDNQRSNKLDGYLTRSVAYDVTVADDGTVEGTLSVTLTNEAPAEGLTDIVTGDGDLTRTVNPLPELLNRLDLALYTGFPVRAAAIDGRPAPYATAEIDPLHRTSLLVDVPAGSTVVVSVAVRGTVDPGSYALTVLPNAGAATDRFTADLDLDGTRVVLEPRPLREAVTVRRRGG